MYKIYKEKYLLFAEYKFRNIDHLMRIELRSNGLLA